MPGMKGTMHEFKAGTLHSGSKSGPKVKSRAQAIAIGMSEERSESRSEAKAEGDDPVTRRKKAQRASAKRAVESKGLPPNFTRGKK